MDEPPAGGDEADAAADEAPMPVLRPVLVTAPRPAEPPLGAACVDEADLAVRRGGSRDAAALLDRAPGVTLYGAGGISSLPVIHGLADDRVRVEVDGTAPTAACPNHMNPALSYVAPSQVGSATVFAGIAPVRIGGDSIGGAVQVDSPAPAFAEAPGEVLARGRAGAFFRSNGNAFGYGFGGSAATRNLHLSYDESHAESDDYEAGAGFKAAGRGSLLPDGEWLDEDVVGSSAFEDVVDRSARLALRQGGHLLELAASRQTLDFEGFPNQRMDMTGNRNLRLRLGYEGEYGWGALLAKLYGQDTRHQMDMGPDRFSYGFGMPMESDARTTGGLLRADVDVSERHVLRLGTDYQTYDLDDRWLPAGEVGAMAPDTFWNVRDGERDRIGVFAEWEASWRPGWTSLLGVRGDTVATNAGEVQGYNDTMGIWTADARAFNERDRRRRDTHVGVVAMVRWAPVAWLTAELGYARQTRSPSLYERYPWSTNAMAALMNNFVGDGNGYIGNVDLDPEVAHTVLATLDWHDGDGSDWGLRVTAYLTRVEDFIDARRCDFGQCSALNATAETGFVLLQYVNQSARLYGVDVSGERLLWRSGRFGSFTATGVLGFVRGENRTTGDDLYQIMPLEATLGLVHRRGGWTAAAEVHLVDDKNRVSRVRNEVPTGSTALLDLRASYAWEHLRVDVSVENVFDELHQLPLGGAYLGQGASMSTLTIPWGVPVPGRGRSLNVALSVEF